MINLDELQKVVTSGKVVTLVVMVDGKELAALSFTLDTVAFKEILEATVVKTPIKIVEKPEEKKAEPKINIAKKKAEAVAGATKVEPKVDPKVAEAAQKKFDEQAAKALASVNKAPVDKHDKTKQHPEFNPIPATAEKPEEDDVDSDGVTAEVDQWSNEDDDDSDVDKTTGEIKETIDPHTTKGTGFASPQQKKPVEAVSAARMDDDIIPEQIIVNDKKETVKENVKNEKVQESSAQNPSPEIRFSEEKW